MVSFQLKLQKLPRTSVPTRALHVWKPTLKRTSSAACVLQLLNGVLPVFELSGQTHRTPN
jgi:hypothetical protein